MQVIGNLFQIIIFITMIGSIFTLLSLFVKKVLHFEVGLWFGILGTVFFIVPITVPQAQIIPAEEQIWMQGYVIASKIWILGMLCFSCYYLLRSVFAFRAVQKFPVCQDEQINHIYQECQLIVNVKQLPKLRFGTLKDPACVITLFHPVIILNKEMIRPMSEQELMIILTHELMHIKRRHHSFQRIYEFACCLNWFNFLMWIAKSDFILSCETDCDKHSIHILSDKVSARDYIAAMLHLLEAVSAKGIVSGGTMSALGYLTTKQRFWQILHKPTRVMKLFMILTLSAIVFITIFISARESRSYFFPYGTINTAMEYSEVNVGE